MRVLPKLWDFWAAVVASTLAFSGIRLRNARAEPIFVDTGDNTEYGQIQSVGAGSRRRAGLTVTK